ncbi:uncharacterized protein LOC117327805 isoform X1 [Pecten maximus]|uniref:uncharacterized protein LOC117327805 isoform X1 n=1 Tax=Pecten maximus TaxID=6579 RepID=UPI0014586BDE|nr:uncharacterized protein LOC117327805 isoform X1 [Pecten maximus]
METIQEHTLRRNQVQFVDDLDPKDVLDVLLDDGILTENDYERVSSGKSRKERCRILLALLPTRGPTAYGSFQRALKQSIYPHLAELMHTDTLSNNDQQHLNMTGRGSKDGLRHSSVCSKCEPLFPSKFSDPELAVTLRKNCCLLMGNIEPNDILDWHYQEFVLGRDECDRIRSGKTRKERFVLFLEEISKCQNNNVLSVFKMSLEKKYGFIVVKLDNNAAETIPTDAVSRLTGPVQHDSENNGTGRSTSDCALREEGDYFSLRIQQGTNVIEDKTGSDITSTYCPTTVVKHTKNTIKRHCDFESVSSDMGLSQADCAFIPNQHLLPMTESNMQKSKRRTIPQYSTDSEDDFFFNQVYQRHHRTGKKHEDGWSEHAPDKNEKSSADTRKVSFSVNPGSLNPGSLPNRRLEVAFNLLSTMINQGQYEKFEHFSNGLKQKYHRNADMMCIIGYLNASKDLFKTNFDSAKKHITSAMELVPKTSNPKYFTLELFTALTRMYITRKKLQKLQRVLDDAKMIIASDPVGCTGRAAGWLYMNDARNMTALIGMLNVHKPNFIAAYKNLHEQAKRSFRLSLTNFQRDGGKDGPFGFGYALCRLTILLLQCGDSGLTMDVLHPDYDDIELAGGYLRQLENSNIPIPKILEVHYLLAKCDYQYRRGNTVRALEYADAAHRLATEINMLEFTEHALNRVVFLRTRTPLVIQTVDEEEASRILFEESSDNSH